MRGTTTYETTITQLDDEFDVKVSVDLKISGDEFEITEITKLEDGSQLVVTSDIMTELAEDVQDHWYDIISDLEAAYADYRYEQYRDERELEL
jgi:hypothetical protein